MAKRKYQIKNAMPRKYAIDDLPLEIMSGIGEIAAWWGYLEFQLGVIIREAIQIDTKRGYLLTFKQPLFSLLGCLDNIAKTDYWVPDKSIRNDITKLIAGVRRYEQERNDYVHGVFGFSDNMQKAYARHLFRLAENRVNPGTEAISAESLSAISDHARGLWDDAQAVTRKLKMLNKTRKMKD
ncbi:MAG: hypothetical protein KF834_04785 [Burkholderiales bacterium]|nr:hypothetical protein [Burkholderiales bacterium]